MRVLVATDLSESANEAIRQAHEWAGSANTFATCHVVPNLQPIVPLFPQSTEHTIVDVAAFPARAEAAVRARVGEVTGRGQDDFEVFVDQGVDYAEIARRATAWKADLVVVGSHGHTGLWRLLLGSVAERVARVAPCPVLVARPSPADGPVVAATDLSDPSLPAIAEGHAQATRRRVPLVAIHVVDLIPSLASIAGVPFGIVPGTVSAAVLEEVRKVATTTLSEALERAHSEGESHVVIGDAAAGIVREAESRHAQLVVVGTHGRTGLAQMALGSVAEKVLRAAPCSVLVVRFGG